MGLATSPGHSSADGDAFGAEAAKRDEVKMGDRHHRSALGEHRTCDLSIRDG